MKNRNLALRSFKIIEQTDLERLRDLARQDREMFFRENPAWAELYANRILGTALCQGAAMHYVRFDQGINDFDVYTFYAANPTKHWYAKRIKSVDFGDPKFGTSEITKPNFVGRRVDLMSREIDVPIGTSLVQAIRLYLSESKTRTAQELAKKAVVILEPDDQLGMVAWSVRS